MQEINWEMNPYRDKMGRQIESDELEILMRDDEYRIVEQTQLGKVFISTVWLGVPYGMDYFETCMFCEGKVSEIEARYQTWNEAIEGHKEIVNRYKRTKK